MRIKLLDPAYLNFTGRLGPIDFTNGLSNYGVAPQQANSLLLTVKGALVAEGADPALQAELDKAKADLVALQAEFDAYKLAHPAE